MPHLLKFDLKFVSEREIWFHEMIQTEIQICYLEFRDFIPCKRYLLNHKRGQTNTNHQQTTTNHQQTTTTYQQATTNYQQTTTNYQQTTRNGHPCISNQKTDVLLLLPAGGNYKDHHDFEIHRQSIRGNCLLLSQDLCEVRKIGSASFGRLNS